MAKVFGLNFDKDLCANRSRCKHYNNDTKCHNMCEWWRLFDYATYIGNLPNDYKQPQPLKCDKCDLTAFTRLAEIKKDILNWVEGGNNLLIKSAVCGNGKTSWACKMMCNYIDKVMWKRAFEPVAIFVNIPKLLHNKKETFSGVNNGTTELLNNIMDADLVIWDDIGVNVLSQYDRDFLFITLDTRASMGKANIFTTNTDSREMMENNIGARLFSRLCKNTEMITIIGKDRRASEWI